jgi:hypothetical protein
MTGTRVVVVGLVRIGVAMAIGAAAAVGLSELLNRSLAVGFYLSGTAVLAIGFVLSAADTETPFYHLDLDRGEREYRVNMSLAYVLVGFLLVGVGVAIEATG